MLTALSDATRATSGGKAAALAVLLTAGLPVPNGFVVTRDSSTDTREDVARELHRMGDPIVAVRSSAMSEDTESASAAGQYDSILAIRGVSEVCEAIAACKESAHAARVLDYWNGIGRPHTGREMAVLVQRFVDADVSGVMFTPEREGESTRIEASWGLGLAVAGGTVTPDTYVVAPDGYVSCTIGRKETRVDRSRARSGLVTSTVVTGLQKARVLNDDAAKVLADLGKSIAAVLDGPQDVEWAIADGTAWILQARPITAPLPSIPESCSEVVAGVLTGTPGSPGVVTAPVRIVRGTADFPRVQPGAVVICPHTSPAWTPLFAIAAGVVTETGGALSHAAIVAREYGIPAVLGVQRATAVIKNGEQITLNGTAGTVTPAH